MMHAKAMLYSNAAIRQLLRRLTRPAELEGLPLARALRLALGTQTALEAVERALKDAFERSGPAGARYERIIRLFDVERRVSRVDAARELRVSPRTFFRIRSEAVQAFADYIAVTLAEHEAERDPLGDAGRVLLEHDPEAAADILRLTPRADAALSIDVMQRLAPAAETFSAIDPRTLSGREGTRAKLHAARLADLRGDHDCAHGWLTEARDEYARANAFDRQIEYEIAAIEFARSRHAGVVADMVPRADAVEFLGSKLGGEHVLASFLAVGEVALLSGRAAQAREKLGAAFQRAREGRSFRSMGFALLRLAEVSMLEGDASEALRLAKAAAISLRAFPDGRIYADTLLARISALLGEPWSPQHDASEYVWMSLAMNGVRLRGALRRSERSNEEVAAEALANARRGDELGYTGIAAFSTATAALALPEEDRAQRNALLVRAWTLLVATGNHLIAYDIFAAPSPATRDLGPLIVDDHAAATLARVLGGFDGIGSIGCTAAIESMSGVWAQLLCAASGTRPPSDTASLADTVAAALVGAGARFERTTDRAMREITTLTGAFLPPAQRERFARRLADGLQSLEFLLENAIVRAS